MSQTTNLNTLTINKLTKAQYQGATLNPNELYSITDDKMAFAGDVPQIPSQSGQSGKFLTTNGSAMSWATVSASSADIFWINISSVSSGGVTTYSADKTYTQITSAINDGQLPVVRYSNEFYNISVGPANYDYMFISMKYFVADAGLTSLIPYGTMRKFTVTSGDAWSFSQCSLADIFIAIPDDTLHSEIAAAYTAGKMIFCTDPAGGVHDANCNIYVPLARYKANADGSEEFVFSSVNKHIHGQGDPEFEIHSIIVDSNDTWTVSDDAIATPLTPSNGEKWYRAPYHDLGVINNMVYVSENSHFIAGTSTGVWYSSDGFNWSSTKIKQDCWVAYGNNYYVALLIDGEMDALMTYAYASSVDGNWTKVQTNKYSDDFDWWEKLYFCSGVFLVCSSMENYHLAASIPSSASNWSWVSINSELVDIASSTTRTVAIGGASTPWSSTTTDGTNWTLNDNNPFGSWYSPCCIAYGSTGGFIAIVSDDGNRLHSATFTSSNGSTWTKLNEDLPWSYGFRLFYDNGKYIAIEGSVWTSVDGSSWTEVTSPLAEGTKWTDFGPVASNSDIILSGYNYSSKSTDFVVDSATINYVQAATSSLPEVFTVNLTANTSANPVTYTADREYLEIASAVTGGKEVQVLLNNTVYYYAGRDTENSNSLLFATQTYTIPVINKYAPTSVMMRVSTSDVWTEIIVNGQAKITASGILKGDGAGGVTAAVAGTDYAAASHNHAASDIISGTLGVARGGTGQTSLTAALSAAVDAVMEDSGNEDGFLYKAYGDDPTVYTQIPVANGGTGGGSFTANSVIMSGSSSVAPFTSRAVTNNTSSTALAANTNIPTMNTVKYGLDNRLNRSTAVNASDTSYSVYEARGEALFSSDATPTANGTICWIYE